MRYRQFVVLWAAGLALLGSLLVAQGATTAPQRQDGWPPFAAFDPDRMGALEQEAWAAYYYRDWPRLLQLLLDLLQGQFGLTPAQAIQAALLATRAQIAFAERGATGGEAEALMREFYVLVRERAGAAYDPDRAAWLEVRWWVVHRERDRAATDTALVDALAALWAEVYGVPAEAVRLAAAHRARAMDYSDRWVAEGREPGSPLLDRVRDELIACYRALSVALARAASHE